MIARNKVIMKIGSKLKSKHFASSMDAKLFYLNEPKAIALYLNGKRGPMLIAAKMAKEDDCA